MEEKYGAYESASGLWSAWGSHWDAIPENMDFGDGIKIEKELRAQSLYHHQKGKLKKVAVE